MAQDKDFSIITVIPDEEDDIVIEAGAGAGAQKAPAEIDNPAAFTADAPSEAAESEVTTFAGTDEFEDAAIDAELDAEPQRINPNAMLTTEEDLHAKGPYVGMQRAILILFIALVVVSIAYWFFIRPTAG